MTSRKKKPDVPGKRLFNVGDVTLSRREFDKLQSLVQAKFNVSIHRGLDWRQGSAKYSLWCEHPVGPDASPWATIAPNFYCLAGDLGLLAKQDSVSWTLHKLKEWLEGFMAGYQLKEDAKRQHVTMKEARELLAEKDIELVGISALDVEGQEPKYNIRKKGKMVRDVTSRELFAML